jgi:cytoskeletal protein RodZ
MTAVLFFIEGHQMKYRVREQGSVVHIVIISVLVLALLGALGFILWQNIVQKQGTDNTTTTPVTQQVYTPSGWTRHQNNTYSLSYAVPEGTTVVVEQFYNGDAIPVGFGAPVYLRYTASGWVSYQNDENNEPTVEQDQNLVKSLSVVTSDDRPASYYITGDGQASETRVLAVNDDQTYQFAFDSEVSNETTIDFVKSIEF